MGVLNLKLRPIVAFDENNRKHRMDFAKFLESGSWKHSKVRYELDESCGELNGAIQRRILMYYAKKEFKINPIDTRVSGY